MSKHQLKRFLWVLLSFAVLTSGLFLMRALADLGASFRRSGNAVPPLSEANTLDPDGHPPLRWAQDDADTGRVMEPFTRSEIAKAYLLAWHQLNLAQAQGDPAGLATYFTGPALDGARATVAQSNQAGWKVTTAHVSHHLRLHFYAADGSIVSFTDQTGGSQRQLLAGDGRTTPPLQELAHFDVVMLLEDGNWRVRHWVRLAPGEVDG